MHVCLRYIPYVHSINEICSISDVRDLDTRPHLRILDKVQASVFGHRVCICTVRASVMADPVEQAASRIPGTPVLTVAAEIGVLKRELFQLQSEMNAMGPCVKQTREEQRVMQREMLRWRAEKEARDTDMLQLKAAMETLKEEKQTLAEELQELKDERARKHAKKKARRDKGAD